MAKTAIGQTVQKFGRLDSIVLNAGTLDPVVRLENAASEEWKECFNINVFANIPLVIYLEDNTYLDQGSDSSSTFH